ncbi:37S ribosomal protein S10, mitochondrial [Neonectria ditissima]|uniref:Small ribosomal subunit protein uS10m n=1 Tax=Neonectria ditissima TaxID=78410 RepID=A0A0P7B8P6_9HYPO|nr:37S ribosomal protein S10, mitochondrial [Neonectria ditissima]
MTAILDDQVDELLRQAEHRLRNDAASAVTVPAPSVAGVKLNVSTAVSQASGNSASKTDLSVRAPLQPQTGLSTQRKATAGSKWFDLPKTDLTPQFKRDWQLLRMRGILDPKHQKKALRASAPEYSHVGEIIAGPTEFYSARMTRKERKGTMLEEIMSSYDGTKFSNKYAGIQKQKTSGKKGFYKKQAETQWLARRAQTTLASPSDLVPNKLEDSDSKTDAKQAPRYPRSIEALHLKPLKREAQYGIPSCDLQLRSYSIQPLEFFSDFALRAAYYLGLPAYGPVPLPRITERWTVPKSHFIFKKAQENFERKTLRRLIQIRDGDPDTVQLWLAYLRKHQYYGVGMKANMWEFSGLGVGKEMDTLSEEQQGQIDSKWAHLGQTKTIGTVEKVEELLNTRRFREAAGLRAPPTTNV